MNRKILKKIKWHFSRKSKTAFYFLRFLIHPFVIIKGIKIPVDTNWSYPMLKALYGKEYEGGEINILAGTLEKKDRVLEIGTGLGFISAFCAKKIGEKNVMTFEANPFLEKRIRKLYQINNVSPNLRMALASTMNGYMDFFFEPIDIWSSSAIKLSQTSQLISVESVDINEVIKGFNPNYLIIDIEGAEYELLPKIDLKSINKIQIELHKKLIGDDKIEYLINYLRKEGFSVIEEFTASEQFYFLRNA